MKTKEKVYAGIVGHLDIEGYPTEVNPDFKEANINDLVYIMLHPILLDFRRKTGRCIRLQREKEIVSVDSETGGTEEFVVMDLISVTKDRFVLVIEAKKASLGKAIKQCLLAMKDMKDNNSYGSGNGDGGGGGDGGGEVYGFVTTGERWRMVRYDGRSFELTENMDVLFDTMGEDKERWMRDYSALVDCMDVALSNGCSVRKDVVN